MGIWFLIFTYPHQWNFVGGIQLTEMRKINMGKMEAKSCRKIGIQTKIPIETSGENIFCLRKVNVFGFLQTYFPLERKQIKVRHAIYDIFLNLGCCVKNYYGIDTTYSQIMMWNFDIRIPMPLWHSKIKAAKILTLKIRYDLTLPSFAHHHIFNPITLRFVIFLITF